jgi:hypothetical protein
MPDSWVARLYESPQEICADLIERSALAGRVRNNRGVAKRITTDDGPASQTTSLEAWIHGAGIVVMVAVEPTSRY